MAECILKKIIADILVFFTNNFRSIFIGNPYFPKKHLKKQNFQTLAHHKNVRISKSISFYMKK
jgi:hypothetical protein